MSSTTAPAGRWHIPAWLVAVMVILAVLGIWRLALPGGSGALSSVPGPGNQQLVTSGGVASRAGQLVSAAADLNAPAPARLLSGRLLPLPGTPIPQLVRIGVEDGRVDVVGAVAGWLSYGQPFPVDIRKGQPVLEYGVRAGRPGIYAVAGVLVTYRQGRAVRHVTAWGGLVDCVAVPHDACSRAEDTLASRMTAYAHHRK